VTWEVQGFLLLGAARRVYLTRRNGVTVVLKQNDLRGKVAAWLAFVLLPLLPSPPALQVLHCHT
jgi:hypothetical protein